VGSETALECLLSAESTVHAQVPLGAEAMGVLWFCAACFRVCGANAGLKEVLMDAGMLRDAIRDIPDFPAPGIIFKDITPILRDPGLFGYAVTLMANYAREHDASTLAAIDARGFLFAGAVARQLGLGLVPIRKPGKLPWKTYEKSYTLEYGTNTLAVHQDAFVPGERVVVIDDLLATGGTAGATAALVEQAGAKVAGVCFLIELSFLNGRDGLSGYDVYAPVIF
jgi:adenine phosphoribosyltransferase